MKEITMEEAVRTTKNFIDYFNKNKCDGNKANLCVLVEEINAIEKVLNELEKKDKIIDAMVEFIDTELSSERLTRVLKKEVLPLETYREDIKQYFERRQKMKENNNEIQNPEEMIKKISKQLYNDEYFIEKAIYTEKAQQNKTFTFFRDDTKNDIQKYCWCQRPCDTNMSLHRFLENGTIEAFMSESLAESLGLIQVDLNEFIWKFVKPMIEENIQTKKRKR